ncbi:7014_t:CDS:2 [Cetraspora pellucida]|uniref:7014_t:CDS:1 n=1 Tax=Cetraspora pellucida TaxID=1433469 RepID=A0ACA9KZF0_9GLOM|nr:7014_t:CDS:2 [Cetraspora pellucida]
MGRDALMIVGITTNPTLFSNITANSTITFNIAANSTLTSSITTNIAANFLSENMTTTVLVKENSQPSNDQ